MADKPAVIFHSNEIYISEKEFRLEAAEVADETCFASGDDDVEETKKTDDDDEETEDKDAETRFESIVTTEEPQVISLPSEPKMPTLEELANSDYIRNRQLAAKSIIENLHQAGSNKEALHSVISIMCKLSEDEDLLVRSELMEHIPSIALFCEEHSEDLGVVIRQQIVPYTVKLLTDIQIQVRKIGHTTLLSLLDNNVIDHSQLSEWICPLIAQLAVSGNTPEDLRTEDVSVMCKMIPYVGKEITQNFFLEPIISLCCDSSASIRKVCAQNFGELSMIMGAEVTELTLLPAFLNLCSDEIWNVRKECADVFTVVASRVSPKTRRDVLPHIYINLLNDESRSVWLAAYQSLGGFIATFAVPWKTEFQYDDGVWYTPLEDEQDSSKIDQQDIQNENNFELLTSEIILNPQFLDECSFKNLNSSLLADNCNLKFDKFPFSKLELNTDNYCFRKAHNFELTESRSKYERALSECMNDVNCNVNSDMTLNFEKKLAPKDGHLYLHVNNENLFNNFQFWRTPLPEVELDVDIEECKSANISVRAKVYNEDDSSKVCASALNVKISPESSTRESFLQKSNITAISVISTREEESSSGKNDFLTKKAWRRFRRERLEMLTEPHEKSGKPEMTVLDQDIVPPELLEKFITSARELPSNEEEKNITCAYNFPAVTYTLGRKYWPCLRNQFHLLSTDLKYTVRKTVASSLHELAVILGHEIAGEDLMPVFVDMLKDEEGVRTKVLMHISKFLKQLRVQDRRQFLPLIQDICMWRNSSNWRYRYTIAEQLIPCVELFTSSEALYFFPVPLSFMQDKVSAVRRSAVELLAVIIKSMAANSKSSDFLKAVLVALDDKYRKSNKWLWRQMYVFICQELAVKRSLPLEFYIDEIVPNLFSLAWDTVANVRLAVARCLGLSLLPFDFLPSIQRAHYQLLIQVMYSLQSDVDKDVRHFAHLSAAAFNVLPPKKLSPV